MATGSTLYQFGPVTISTFPFNADEASRDGAADFAEHGLLGRMPGREFMGEGNNRMSLVGQILPTKFGGLQDLETLHKMRRTGTRAPLVRGDGVMLGWFALESIREDHSLLNTQGVGQIVRHELRMVEVDPPSEGPVVNILNL